MVSEAIVRCRIVLKINRGTVHKTISSSSITQPDNDNDVAKTHSRLGLKHKIQPQVLSAQA